MKIILIQHTAVDGPGVVSDFLAEHQIESTIIRVDRGDAIPATVQADALMIFGGPQSLHLPDLPAWVEQQQRLIRRYVDENRHVFGICLGAQLIASALGASTGPNKEPEVGWHEVMLTAQAKQSELAKHLPDRQVVLHWHQNTFALPSGSTHLFQSDGCKHQGFCIGNKVVGLQFHPETTAKTIDYYLKVSKLCRLPGPFVQSPEQIEQGIANYLPGQNGMLRMLLSGWLL